MIDLSSGLIADVDPIEFLTVLTSRVASVIGAAEVGIMLRDSHAQLQRVASTSERMRSLELLELQSTTGPCIECLVTGAPVVDLDIPASRQRWSEFAQAAGAAGFSRVYAFPLRSGTATIGAMNVFLEENRSLSHGELATAQAMANLAAAAVTQQRTTSNLTQLERALASRVVIEQAKGILAEQLRVDVTDAFKIMRHYARSANRRLTDVAGDVANRRLAASDLALRPRGTPTLASSLTV